MLLRRRSGLGGGKEVGMEVRQFLERLVPELTRNASVVGIDETDESYQVTIAGTTGVVAQCRVPRETIDAAVDHEAARRTLATLLKACADRVVAPVSDGRS
jgi:hypothetical protein